MGTREERLPECTCMGQELVSWGLLCWVYNNLINCPSFMCAHVVSNSRTARLSHHMKTMYFSTAN